MKKLIIYIKENYKLVIGVLLTGIILGWLIFGAPGDSPDREEISENHEGHDHEDEGATTWTCSMHPQIKQDKPGDCPICGMDLIPLESMGSENDNTHPDEIMMSESSAKLADIETTVVGFSNPEKTLFLQGKIIADERLAVEITSRFGGRIEELFVNFTGENVQKGEKLASIYSPELVNAQKELLEAATMRENRPAIYKAAKSKLKLWDLNDDQISAIEDLGEPKMYFDVLAPASGTVMKRHVSQGDYVSTGDVLFMVTDLSKLWIIFDAYEADLPWISLGDKIEFKVQSLPGQSFDARVSFINPIINPKTRSAGIRVEINNQGQSLKPEMFAEGILYSSVAAASEKLMIPKSAVLWTGKRSVVYVKIPEREMPSFLYREITLGPEAGDFYVVAEGLEQGEEIATNGVFKIDASAQLEGKRSMMNPEGSEIKTGAGQKDLVQFKVDPLFRSQLTKLYDAYLPMKDAFVESHQRNVTKTGKQLQPALEAIDMQLLSGEAHIVWMKYLETLRKALLKILDTRDIEEQRSAFSDFNDAFYKTVKSFGLENKKVYYMFCPMAFDDTGAYWLSNEEQIANPYFGDVMLRCGEVKEVIE